MMNDFGVLFDLDGVLLDSEGTYTRFWEEIDALYPTGVDNFSQVIKGSNLATILDTYFPAEKHDEIVEILQRFQAEMKYTFFDGALDLLRQLSSRGVKYCIVTSSDGKKMRHLYDQHPDFETLTPHVVVGEMVAQPKPDPECFILGAQMIGCDIARCVVIEDSLKGLSAGMTAGAKVIALATTLPRERLTDKANVVYNDIKQITFISLVTLFTD